MHNIPSSRVLPGVEKGVVLAFPCPGCKVWARPSSEPCGCYVCVKCGHHSPAWLIQLCYRITRSFQPRNLTYN